MRADIKEKTSKAGAEALRWLVSHCSAEDGSFWRLNPANPDHVPRICGAASQLIEAVNWLGCHEEIYPHIECLCEYLIQQTIRQSVRLSVHSSRLKAILQFAFHNPNVCDWNAISRSLKHVTENAEFKYDDLFDFLCITDLIGYALSLNDKRVQVFTLMTDGQALCEKMRIVHASCLARLKNIIDNELRPHDTAIPLNPQLYSFLLWQLFISGKYDTGEGGSKDNMEFQSAIGHLMEISEEYDRHHRFGKHYQAFCFPEIVYPKLMLAWLHRKNMYQAPLNDFYEWLDFEMRRMLMTNIDPFHIGLALKACIAANKEGVRRSFRETTFSTALEAYAEKASAHRIAVQDIMIEILYRAQKIKVNVVEPLMPGWSSAKLYRMTWEYSFPAEVLTQGAVPKPFVVKLGDRDDFMRASAKYSALSHETKALFASHDASPSVILKGQTAPIYYLVMEELRDYEPLGKQLSHLLPADASASVPFASVGRLLQGGLDAIQELHKARVVSWVPFEEGEPTNNYMLIARAFESVQRLIKKNRNFGRLPRVTLCVKDRLHDEKIVNHPKEIIRQLLNVEGRLNPKKAQPGDRQVLIHGDCHAHNIMVDTKKAGPARFVDIDGLSRDDYLLDYAAFVAHVCLTLPFEMVSDDELDLRVLNDARDTRKMIVDIDTKDWGHLGVQNNAFRICRDAVDAAIRERGEQEEAMMRFYLYLACRLLFIASKSRTANKAIIFFIQGLSLLEGITRALGRKRFQLDDTVPASSLAL